MLIVTMGCIFYCSQVPVVYKYWIALRRRGIVNSSDGGHERVMTRCRCYAETMRLTLDPFRLLLISLAGYLNQQQQDVIDYLQEENRVLREQLGTKRLRLNDDQRRRLA